MGKRSPANLQSVLASLDKLDKIKRIPKKKIYAKGSRQNKSKSPQSGCDFTRQ